MKVEYGVMPGTQQDGYGMNKYQEFYIYDENGTYGDAPFEDVTFTINFFFADTTKQTEKIYWANWDGLARKLETKMSSYKVEKCEIKGFALDRNKSKRTFEYTWKKQ
jgi:hypothetical protein